MDRSLNAISPIDGRYRKVTEPLAVYFSESAIIRYRLMVEAEYFIALCNIPLPQLRGFNKDYFPEIRSVYTQFKPEDAIRVKEIEKVTNHDVKAIEYFLKEKFNELNISENTSKTQLLKARRMLKNKLNKYYTVKKYNFVNE